MRRKILRERGNEVEEPIDLEDLELATTMRKRGRETSDSESSDTMVEEEEPVGRRRRKKRSTTVAKARRKRGEFNPCKTLAKINEDTLLP